jgi:hypothetical protein
MLQNPAKLPAALAASTGEFKLTLLLSTLSDAISQDLGSISLPHSALKPTPRGRHDLPPRAGEPAFHPQTEIFHTFQPEPKQVGVVKSGLGVVLVIVPWLVLAVLVRPQSISPPCLLFANALREERWADLRSTLRSRPTTAVFQAHLHYSSSPSPRLKGSSSSTGCG